MRYILAPIVAVAVELALDGVVIIVFFRFFQIIIKLGYHAVVKENREIGRTATDN